MSGLDFMNGSTMVIDLREGRRPSAEQVRPPVEEERAEAAPVPVAVQTAALPDRSMPKLATTTSERQAAAKRFDAQRKRNAELAQLQESAKSPQQRQAEEAAKRADLLRQAQQQKALIAQLDREGRQPSLELLRSTKQLFEAAGGKAEATTLTDRIKRVRR